MKRALSVVAALLLLSLALDAQGQPIPTDAPPTDAQQAAILASMRRYAEQYVANLPNFTCVQVTEQFESGMSTQKWRKGDTISAKLVFTQGKEQRTLEMVNYKPIRADKMHKLKEPLVTEGEFGVLLGNIFEALSDTGFKWQRWEDLNGKKLMVFDFSIDKAHSGLTLGLSESTGAVVAYQGSVYADPSDGSVWKVTQALVDIPPELLTKTSVTEIEYQVRAIGGTQYLLPAHATILLDTGLRHIRNQLTFQEYRKFEVESKITFTPDTGSTAAQPQ